MSGVSIHTDISADFTNPLAKQVARIWQVPFAIEILLPLETSDLNPGGICAPDCRLILVSLSLFLSPSPILPSLIFSFLARLSHPSCISVLLFHYSSLRGGGGGRLLANVEFLVDRFWQRTLPC